MIHLTTLNRERGQRRFYHIEIIPSLFGQWGVQREWGRLGQSGTLRVNWYDSKEQAQMAATKLADAKIEIWYREFHKLNEKLICYANQTTLSPTERTPGLKQTSLG